MWACTVCTLENRPTATECEVCNQPRHDSSHSQTELWQCANCCLFNKEHLARCATCNHRKGVRLRKDHHSGSKSPPAAVADQAKEIESEKLHQRKDSREAGETQQSGTRDSTVNVTEQENSWVCQNVCESGVCHTVNNPDVYRCSNCNKSKPYLPELVTLVSQVKDVLAGTSLGETPSNSEPVGNLEQDDLPSGDGSSKRQGSKQREDQFYIDWSSMEVRREETCAAHDAELAERGFPPAAFHLNVEEEDVEFPDHECRLVLVGKTGNGKSSLANTLLGMRRFEVCANFASATKKCQRHNMVRFGVRLEVVDTPGFFDTELDKETIAKEIAKCFGIIAPGPHAIILVLRIGVRFTKEENGAVEEVFKVFGAHLLRYLVIVFTHGDRLEGNGESCKARNMEAMLDSAPDKLKQLLTRANHRYVVFDNTADEATKSRQVKELLLTVKKLLAVNGGSPLTSETLDIVERCMKQRESELEDEIHKGERRRSRSGRKGGYRFQYRDMARDEVVQESPLLDTIKTHVLPILKPILWNLLTTLLSVVLKKGGCSLQ